MTTPDPNAWKCWRDPRHETMVSRVLGWPRCLDCGASPSYADRWTYVDEYLELAVYVPAADRLATVAPRSAIVGPIHHDGDHRIEVYLEGWVNGPAQYADRDARGLWEAGVGHAAERLVVQYPTVAKIEVPWSDLLPVANFWPKQKRIVVHDEDSLNTWLETER